MLGPGDCNFLRGVVGGKGVGVTYDELARLLRRVDWTLVSSRGSHRVWRNAQGRRIVLVDRGHGPVLPVYAKLAARAILEGGQCQ